MSINKFLAIIVLMGIGIVIIGNNLFSKESHSASVTQAKAPARATNEITCRISRWQYDQLRFGMSYSQVVSILGCGGDERVRSDTGNYRGAIYAWKGAGDFGANMSLQFSNGELIMKSQFGLR